MQAVPGGGCEFWSAIRALSGRSSATRQVTRSRHGAEDAGSVAEQVDRRSSARLGRHDRLERATGPRVAAADIATSGG